mmetsp:Transcript_140255/g.244282  ORF Transcript_140255/g.244282 Transcript_140255/m.244282 type:complete len:270 (-) Transcript_140255:133-942(-)
MHSFVAKCYPIKKTTNNKASNYNPLGSERMASNLTANLHRLSGLGKLALKLELNGGLCLMRVGRALVDLQVAEKLTAKRTLGQHPFNGLLNDALGDTCLQLIECLNLHRTGTPGNVPPVELLAVLLSTNFDLLGVDNYHVVSHIRGRVEFRFVLTTQNTGNLSCHAAQPQTLGINHVPFFVGKGGIGSLRIPSLLSIDAKELLLTDALAVVRGSLRDSLIFNRLNCVLGQCLSCLDGAPPYRRRGHAHGHRSGCHGRGDEQRSSLRCQF